MPGVLGCRVRRVTPDEPALDKASLGAGGVENATRGGPKVRVLGPPGVGEGVTTRVAPGGSGTGGMEGLKERRMGGWMGRWVRTQAEGNGMT